MEETTQLSDPISRDKVSEVIPAPGEALTLLLPLAAPAIAYAVRGVLSAIARRQEAKIKAQHDSREFLQQQNELLLKELLDRTDDPKNQ